MAPVVVSLSSSAVGLPDTPVRVLVNNVVGGVATLTWTIIELVGTGETSAELVVIPDEDAVESPAFCTVSVASPAASGDGEHGVVAATGGSDVVVSPAQGLLAIVSGVPGVFVGPLSGAIADVIGSTDVSGYPASSGLVAVVASDAQGVVIVGVVESGEDSIAIDVVVWTGGDVSASVEDIVDAVQSSPLACMP